MIRVYMASVDALLGSRSREDILAGLCPGHRAELAERPWGQSTRESAAGEMLLQRAVEMFPSELVPTPVQWTWSRGECGKPCIPELPWEFNLSHSGGMVACALGTGTVGIDIQTVEEPRPGILKRFYTEKERQQVESAADPARKFTELWALREAAGKWESSGLIRPPESAAPFARVCSFGQLVLALCSEEPWDGTVDPMGEEGIHGNPAAIESDND